MPIDYSKLEPELQWLRDRLIASERDYIELEITDTQPQYPWQTQIGGHPYLVDAEEFPRDPEGQPLGFLAQLNFAELPPLEGYPTEGLLQFFVGVDDVFGATYGDEPDRFHVSYHPRIDTGWRPRNEWPQIDEEDTPLLRPSEGLLVTGKRDRMPVPDMDRRFAELVGDEEYETTDYSSVRDVMSLLGSRVGGYPFVIFADERDDDKDLLLLHLDSDGHSMEWGDGGTARFYISVHDLAARDFSNVQYFWECF